MTISAFVNISLFHNLVSEDHWGHKQQARVSEQSNSSFLLSGDTKTRIVIAARRCFVATSNQKSISTKTNLANFVEKYDSQTIENLT